MLGFYDVAENGMMEDGYGPAVLRGGVTSIMSWSAVEAKERDSAFLTKFGFL